MIPVVNQASCADVANLFPHIQTNPEWQLAIDQGPQMAVEKR